MLLEAALIAGAGILNIGGLVFIKKRLKRLLVEDDKHIVRYEGNEPERWFTVGIVEHHARYADSKETYWINYALKASNLGARRVEIHSKGGSTHLTNHATRVSDYLLYIQPWTEGVITLDDLARECKGAKLVPNKQLKNL